MSQPGDFKPRSEPVGFRGIMGGDFKPGLEPDGFRGIKWRTDINTLPDMEYFEIEAFYEDDRFYIKRNDELKMGSAVLHNWLMR